MQADKIYSMPAPDSEGLKTYSQEVELTKDQKIEADLLKTLLDRQEAIKKLIKSTIVFSEPILTLRDFGLCYAGTLTLIQGRKGSFKSKFLETMAVSLIANLKRVQVEFTKNPIFDVVACYIDTERNFKEQFPAAIQRILKAAGHNPQDDIQNFTYFSLIEIERDLRLKAIKVAAEHLRKNNPHKQVVIFIDVFTDLLENFNDVGQTMELTDYLNSLCNQFDICIIAVIHENKNDSNSRGHAGTEATNKASLVARVESDRKADLVRLEILHSRNQREPKDAIHFKFDEFTKLLKLAEKTEVLDAKIEGNPVMRCVLRILSSNDKIAKSTLTEQVQLEHKVSSRTVESILTDLVKLDQVIKEKAGKSVWFAIKRQESIIDISNTEQEAF